MNLYRFRTFRTSYFFPAYSKKNSVLYKLYSPFGKAATIYWGLFRHFSIIRWINRVDKNSYGFPYDKITCLCPKDCVLSFNMGTPGPEQKISMLGLTISGDYFFAKYSERPSARKLSENEIHVLSTLKHTGIVPYLYDYKVDVDYCFFRTSCVDGDNPKDLNVTDEVVDLAIKISKNHLYLPTRNEEGLRTGLSHGDFTPWNLKINSSGYHMIDWEMADERELGYDIFTYIAHVNNIFHPEIPVVKAIDNQHYFIDTYFEAFDIKDWSPYLVAFAKNKIKYELSKGNVGRADDYKCLL